MDSPADHVADYLESLGLLAVAVVPEPAVRIRTVEDMVASSSEAWRGFVGTEPTDPDNCVTVYDTGGAQATADVPLYDPTIQIRVRARNYGAGYSKALELRDALTGPTGFLLDGWHYAGFWIVSDVAKIGRDDNNRELFTVNFRAMRQRVA